MTNSVETMDVWRNVGAAFARRYPPIAAAFTTHLRWTLFAGAGLAIAVYMSTFLHSVLTAQDLITVQGPIVGGDFVVFWTAAREALSGDAIALYNPAQLEAALAANFPGKEDFRLLWLYPPAMLALITPFGALPYLPAYAAWVVSSLALFGVLLWRLWRNPAAVFFALTSLAAFQGWITGQTGFLTATLLGVAATQASKRPLVAGFAAGLLVIKPQFGLLIPIAFAAANCWRAFAAAALTGTMALGASAAIYGVDAYVIFLDAMQAHGGNMNAATKYFSKIITPFGAASLVGAPYEAAIGLHLFVAAALAIFVAFVWRRTSDWDLRAMALLIATPFASPYALYYEMTIFIPAAFLVARRASAEGWLSWERPGLAILWVAPLLLPVAETTPSFPWKFAGAACVFMLVARRLWQSLPQARPVSS